ncbi:MAG: 30S ribosomal protein S2 [Opitutales bacterium]|nr:30S ribosomal protein S2 [Opitutales bacterium]
MNVELTDLLDAGVHFGHQVKRWNPKSKSFVFDHRQGISIIDLSKSYSGLKAAHEFVEETAAKGGEILFVGTKRQAQEVIREAAAECGMPFCASRWLGGTLTNWQTITRSIAKYKKYQSMEADGSLSKLPKKEGSAIRREMERMNRNFEGIVKMEKPPAAMIVVDVKYEDIAIGEAKRCKIPVAALVDTNSDPSLVDYPIPGNDDAVKAIRIILEVLVEGVQSGLAQRQARQDKAGAQKQAAATAQEMVAAPAVTEEEAAPTAKVAAPVVPEEAVSAVKVAAPVFTEEAAPAAEEAAPAAEEAAPAAEEAAPAAEEAAPAAEEEKKDA